MRTFARLIHDRGLDIDLVGVGGASDASHVFRYLEAGAASVHIATAAMTNPLVAIEIKRQLRATGITHQSNPDSCAL